MTGPFEGFDAYNDKWLPFQEDTTCTRLECCRHLHKLCLHNPRDGGPIRFFGKPAVAPFRLAGSAPHKSGGPLSQTNTQETSSIRCNHTHWVHLICTQIKQRQYKNDWRCTIHAPTQNVTTTQQHITNNNQPKDKNTSYFKST